MKCETDAQVCVQILLISYNLNWYSVRGGHRLEKGQVPFGFGILSGDPAARYTSFDCRQETHFDLPK